MLRYSIALILVFAMAGSAFAADSVINHKVTATVEPKAHTLEATDVITIPADMARSITHFLLVGDLTVTSETPGVTVRLDATEIKGKDFGMDQEDFEESSSIVQNKYSIDFGKIEGDVTVTLKFHGKIFYPIEQMGEEYARGFSQTPGLIEERGVYLAGSTWWVPWFNDQPITFELTAEVPPSWNVVSQGRRTLHEIREGKRVSRWESPELMEEIFFIAAPFTEYGTKAGMVDVMAFLRTPDENLANKYLETTSQYLGMYLQLVGPYPFSKFALVENFWETGYGMPSFTLLGEQVIRFPFILHSSYPHELLHNWWGNSVYVDFKTGNWCEGITTYMADHLIKEQRGQGDDYRRSTLQKYTDYVTPESDFPLNEFLSRNNAASEAVGYGKSLMIWNMLREEVGDKQFILGFQKFYSDNRYLFASFDDIRSAFENVTERDLGPFFMQWIERTGAPEMRISDVEVEKTDAGYKLKFSLAQIQDEDVFELKVPLAVSFAEKVEMKHVRMIGKTQSFEMSFPDHPLLVRVDPQFNLFRRLHYNEIPPALSRLHGSENILILLPSAAEKSEMAMYRQLADIWSKDTTKDIEVAMDKDFSSLPADRPVWVFGENNRYRARIEDGLKDYDVSIGEETVRFGKTTLSLDNNSIIAAVRHPGDPGSVIAWLTIDNPEAVTGLSRKLLHYGKYSYLGFTGTEPANIVKGQWPAVNSPLSIEIPVPGADRPGKIATKLTPRQALATLPPPFSASRMMKHVEYLASDQLQGRGLGSEGIEKAAEYIAAQFEEAGLKPACDNDSYFQEFETVIDAEGNKGVAKNVVAVMPGTNPDYAGESVVVSAHYDHLGLGWPGAASENKGRIHPGADDNASGVAVMMELAAVLNKTLKPERSIVFVAFSAEESGLRGSEYYVKHMVRYSVDKTIGALNLDTVGRLGENKLLVLSSSSAREWKFIFMGAGYVSGVEAEMVTQDLDASDQRSFIAAGVPAVQFFSGATRDYHRPSDTADKIDGPGMVKVAGFVRESIVYLAERKEPLSFAGDKGEPGKPVASGERKVTTGTMPDFSYSGIGVKIADLSPDSPAARAGLKKGDVIVRLGEHEVTDLKAYANALKSFNPGDVVPLEYIRDGKQRTTEIKLIAR